MANGPDSTKNDHGAPAAAVTIIGRFVLGQQLGAGGMGQVYAAEDTLLARRVAIKRMAPKMQFDERDRARFLKEAQRASALSHPNIAAIYDVLEHQGEILLVMEYVEGVTLRHRCAAAMGVAEFLDIAQQCADGLSAAHAEHIVHADIKPENIMLTPSGRVKILDFGVAKRFASEGPDEATQTLATMTGMLSGTPAYMAPEVLTRKIYDGRADLFSLGLVFYEMLGGRQPFVADSVAETMGQVLHTQVPPLGEVNNQVPPAIAQVVTRLLEKKPENRYASASALLADLRTIQQGGNIPTGAAIPLPPVHAKQNRARLKLAAFVFLAALAVAAIFVWYKPAHSSAPGTTAGTPALPQTQILAVLPFKSVDGDPKLTALGEGLVESVAAKLSQLSQDRSLEVITARNLKDKHISSLSDAHTQFGANLGVTIALQSAGGLMHASYALVDAQSGRTLTGESIAVPSADVFSVEDDIAQGTARALHVNLRSGEQAALRIHGTTQPAAYGYYLQARGYLVDYSQPENVENAIVMANEALKLDPRFGMARAALGEAYWRKYSLTKNKKWTATARTECDAAVKLGNAGEAGHICLGLVNDGTGEYRAASTEYQRAAELEPFNQSAALGLALALEHQGAIDEAEKAYQHAGDLHPQSYFTYNALGGFYYRRAELDKAIAMFQKVTQLAPEGYVGFVNLGGVYNEAGRYSEAIPVLNKSISLRPTYGAYANLGTSYFASSKYADAATAYREAAKLDPEQYVTWGNLGAALFYGGQKAEAVRVYRKAADLAAAQLKVNSRDTDVLGDICEYYAMMGDRTQALNYLGQALQYGHSEKELLVTAAQVYNEIGETGLALEWLTKAVQAGYPPNKFRDFPAFRNLSDNPRFRELIKR